MLAFPMAGLLAAQLQGRTKRARRGPGVPAVAQHPPAVHPDVAHPRRQLVGLLEGGVVRDRLGVEDHHVGEQALAQQAPLAQAQAVGHGRGHLADRLLQGQDPLVADVAAEDARIGAVAAGVHRPQVPRPGRVDAAGVGGDLDPRLDRAAGAGCPRSWSSRWCRCAGAPTAAGGRRCRTSPRRARRRSPRAAGPRTPGSPACGSRSASPPRRRAR